MCTGKFEAIEEKKRLITVIFNFTNSFQWRTQKGGLGVLPPEKFWIFRPKNARFLSFETPYPMYFHG